MKIGILTLHDSPNYGALLQACALRAYLTALGHDVHVIDKRRDAAGAALRTPPKQRESIRLLGLLRVDSANGQRAYSTRCVRSIEFQKSALSLGDVVILDWKDSPKNLGLDLIVVGSDQVWNANNLNPDDYLLGSVPGSPKGIAYAASIGMPSFPVDKVETYRAGFARFAALGVREREAVELVKSLGFEATHVVDPVLLAGSSVWNRYVTKSASLAAEKRKVFAYFLAEDVEKAAATLSDFAAREHCRVELFVDWFVRKTPRGLMSWLKARRFWSEVAARGIDFRLDAGPIEFVQSIAEADLVVSNSYHALMFALLFGKEVRIVLPTHPVRRKMNARLKEFEGEIVSGKLVYDDLESALAASVGATDQRVDRAALDLRIQQSREWLANALESVR